MVGLLVRSQGGGHAGDCRNRDIIADRESPGEAAGFFGLDGDDRDLVPVLRCSFSDTGKKAYFRQSYRRDFRVVFFDCFFFDRLFVGFFGVFLAVFETAFFPFFTRFFAPFFALFAGVFAA